MTSRQIRVGSHARLPYYHLDGLPLWANRELSQLARIRIIGLFPETHLLGVEFNRFVLVLNDNRDV